MKRTSVFPVIAGSALLMLPVACSDGPLAPVRSPLEVRVLADTIPAAISDWGPARSANFTTVVELANRSRADVVEFYLCGSIVLRERARPVSYGAACPGMYVPPIVLGPGAATTIEYAHFLCLAGSCLRDDGPAALDATYEVRVHYQAVRALPFADGTTVSRDEVARSNVFAVTSRERP